MPISAAETPVLEKKDNRDSRPSSFEVVPVHWNIAVDTGRTVG